ncbi:hypothetical protein AMTR_s00131p00020490, partial [Amborella trichopoda]
MSTSLVGFSQLTSSLFKTIFKQHTPPSPNHLWAPCRTRPQPTHSDSPLTHQAPHPNHGDSPLTQLVLKTNSEESYFSADEEEIEQIDHGEREHRRKGRSERRSDPSGGRLTTYLRLSPRIARQGDPWVL